MWGLLTCGKCVYLCAWIMAHTHSFDDSQYVVYVYSMCVHFKGFWHTTHIDFITWSYIIKTKFMLTSLQCVEPEGDQSLSF